MILDMRKNGQKIGFHFALNGQTNVNIIRENIIKEVHLLSQMLGFDIEAFSFHRPPIFVLAENMKFDNLLNTYQNEFFTFNENVNDKSHLEVKYISDARHQWNYGVPNEKTLLEYKKIQILIHPYSWTKDGYDNLNNFKSLLSEKEDVLKDTLDNECKNFAEVKELL